MIFGTLFSLDLHSETFKAFINIFCIRKLKFPKNPNLWEFFKFLQNFQNFQKSLKFLKNLVNFEVSDFIFNFQSFEIFSISLEFPKFWKKNFFEYFWNFQIFLNFEKLRKFWKISKFSKLSFTSKIDSYFLIYRGYKMTFLLIWHYPIMLKSNNLQN